MKKYAVITFQFNHYELLREPSVIDEDADYYCITDDKCLRSDKWNIIYLEEFNTDNLTGIQKTYMAKYSFYKYIPTDYEYYFAIDGSMKVTDKLSPILQFMSENEYDIGLSIHPLRNTWNSEYEEWIRTRGLDRKYKNMFDTYAENNGFNPNSSTGLIECTMKIYKNTDNVIKFIDDVYETLKETNNFEDKNDQCYFTLTFRRHYKSLCPMFFCRQLYSNSKYFTKYQHNSNCIFENHFNRSNNPKLLFGENVEIFDF